MQAITMKQTNTQLARILTYAGTLPLITCVALSFAPIDGIDHKLFASSYSAIILSFLCGIHWAIFLYFSDKFSLNLFITSNLIALLAWCSLLVAHQQIALIFQGLCFLFLLMLDFKLRREDILPEWFYQLRRNATSIVVFCLAAMAVL